MRRLILALLFALPVQASAYCFDVAAAAYGVPQALLMAIAQEESGMRADVVRENTNGSKDIGLMQINTVWLPELAVFGITDDHLLNPCMNVSVGAWILSKLIARHGMTWEAVGRYHSATPGRKERYAINIYRQIVRGARG